MLTTEHIIDDSETSTQHTTERPDNVRLAGMEDEDALYVLLCALEEDNGFGIPKNEHRVRAAIEKGTRRLGSMIGVIDGKAGRYGESKELAASVCLTLAQFWYSDQWYLAEQWVFVHPDYRGNRLDRDLFQFAKWCREEMGRKTGENTLLITSVSSPTRLQAKMRLWARHGRQVGGIFTIGG